MPTKSAMQSEKQTQIRELENLRIPAEKQPPLPLGRVRLIEYIKEGNGVIPTMTPEERAALYLQEHQRLVGKDVIQDGDQIRKCKHLLAKSAGQVREERKYKGELTKDSAPIHPLYGICDITSAVSCDRLIPVDEG